MATIQDIASWAKDFGLYGQDPTLAARTSTAPPPTPKSDFFGNLGNTLKSIPGAAGGFLKNTFYTQPSELGKAIGEFSQAGNTSKSIDFQNKQILNSEQFLKTAWQTGKISKVQYQTQLKSLIKQQQGIGNQVSDLKKQVSGKMLLDKAAPVALTIGTLAAGLAPEGAIEDALGGAASKIAGEGSKAAEIAAKVGGGFDQTLGIGKAAGATTAAEAGAPEAASTLQALAAPITKAVRTALVIKPDINAVGQIGGQIKKGQYGQAAKTAALNFGIPTAIGLAGKYIPKVAGKLKSLTFDSQGLWDKVKLGGTSVNEIVNATKSAVDKGTADAGELKKMVNALKVAQDHVLTQAHGDVNGAAALLTDYEKAYHIDLAKASLPEYTNFLEGYAKSGRKFQNAGAAGKYALPTGETFTGKVGVGKSSNTDVAALVKGLAVTSKEDQANFINTFSKTSDMLKNEHNSNLVNNILKSNMSPDEIKAELNSKLIRSNALMIKNAKGELIQAPTDKRGYFPIVAAKGAAQFKKPSQVAELVQGTKAPLGAVGRTLEKAGISPIAGSPTEQKTRLIGNLRTELGNIEPKGNFSAEQATASKELLGGKAQSIYTELVKQLKPGVPDIRLLSKGAVQDALDRAGVDENLAPQIKKAIETSFTKLPLSVRGLGPHITDEAMAHIPGMKSYLKIQSIGRFGKANPFFQGKVLTKGNVLAQSQGGGFNPLGTVSEDAKNFLKGSSRELDAAVSDGFGPDLPKIQRGIVSSQLKNQAGLMIDSMAKRAGMDTKTFLTTNQGKAEKAVQAVFGYPKGGFLDSNMAKTLNTAIFPFRFEAKIASAAGHYFGKQDVLTRVAVVNNLLRFDNFINSKQGQDWYHKNYAAIGLVKYLSPIQTFGAVWNTIKGKGALQDIGQLGGLPFGVISTILTHQGVNLGKLGSSPYKLPDTGQLYKEPIPQTGKARLEQLFSDILSSMYTYPGATIGAPSKTSISKTVVDWGSANTLKTKASEYNNPNTKPFTSKSTPSISTPIKQIKLPTPIYNQKSTIPKMPKAKKPKFYPKPI